MAKGSIGVGSTAPDFSVNTVDGQTIRLSNVLATHHAVLYFVREYT